MVRLRKSSRANCAADRFSALTQISQAAAEMAAVCDVAHALAEQETLEQISGIVVNRALALLPGHARDRFVEEDEFRVLREEHGDLQPLPLAVGELGRAHPTPLDEPHAFYRAHHDQK